MQRTNRTCKQTEQTSHRPDSVLTKCEHRIMIIVLRSLEAPNFWYKMLQVGLGLLLVWYKSLAPYAVVIKVIFERGAMRPGRFRSSQRRPWLVLFMRCNNLAQFLLPDLSLTCWIRIVLRSLGIFEKFKALLSLFQRNLSWS